MPDHERRQWNRAVVRALAGVAECPQPMRGAAMKLPDSGDGFVSRRAMHKETPTRIEEQCSLDGYARVKRCQKWLLSHLEKLRSGLSARYIGQVERRRASPSIDVLERLAEAFGVRPTQLLRPMTKNRRRTLT